MKFTKRLLWKWVKSPTSFLSLRVAEGRQHIPWALCDYNVARLLFLCGSLTSLKDNSKRSSKDMLSSGRISQGITLNDSFPLDPRKKLITFHMQIDTPQVYCLSSFIYSNGISELLPSVPHYIKCYRTCTSVALFFWPCYLLGGVRLVKRKTPTDLTRQNCQNNSTHFKKRVSSCLASATRTISPFSTPYICLPESVSQCQAVLRVHSMGECLDSRVPLFGFAFSFLGCLDLSTFQKVLWCV